MAQRVSVDRATSADRPEILALLVDHMGWGTLERADVMWTWKHEANPFGASPVWIARDAEGLIGIRTFLRWDLRVAGGGLAHAVRAVDTVTHPRSRGSGVFRTLTMTAVDALTDDGIEFVFNTPNDLSRPGYLKMGWHDAGRLPIHLRVLRPTRAAAVWRERSTPAVLTDEASQAAPPSDAELARHVIDPDAVPLDGAQTNRSLDWLRWRYVAAPCAYRAVDHEDGAALIRVRRRGGITEATIADLRCDVEDVAQHNRRTARVLAGVTRAARRSGADVATLIGRRRLDRRWLSPRNAGPTLVARSLAGHPPEQWDFSAGDVELF